MIECAYYRADHHRIINVPGARARFKQGAWQFPATPMAARSILEHELDVLPSSAETYRHCLMQSELLAAAEQRRDAGDLEPSKPADWGVLSPLWSHQLEAVEFARYLPAALFHMGMGTGKTLATIRLILERHHERVLIVCPKAVIRTWIAEFDKHSDMNYAAKPIDGDAKKRLKRAREIYLQPYYKGPRIAVVNYESLWRPKPFADFLLEADIDLVVYDEIQRIKAPGGKASRYCARLSSRVPYRLGLSGTPEPHSPMDSYGVFRALDAGIFGTNYRKFEARYAIKGGFETRQVIGYQNEEEYAARRRTIVFRVKTEDAVDLPATQHRVIECRLEGKVKKAYLDLRDEFVADVEGGQLTADHALTRMLRLQQLTSGHLDDDEGETLIEHNTKIIEWERQVYDIEPDEPAVVFARFRWDVDNLVKRCEEQLGRKAYELSGKRDELEEWQNADGGEVLIVQIQSGSEGVDLTRARYCFYFSIGHSLGQYEQSLARLARPGQTRPVVYTHLVTVNTIDQAVYRALRKKRRILDHILEEIGENRW